MILTRSWISALLEISSSSMISWGLKFRSRTSYCFLVRSPPIGEAWDAAGAADAPRRGRRQQHHGRKKSDRSAHSSLHGVPLRRRICGPTRGYSLRL